MNNTTSIYAEIRDSNTLSGSADKFRNATSMYWASIDIQSKKEYLKTKGLTEAQISTIMDIAVQGKDIEFMGASSDLASYVTVNMATAKSSKPNFYAPWALSNTSGDGRVRGKEFENKFDVLKRTRLYPADSNAIIKSYRFPMRIIGSETAFYNDDEWLAYLVGGGYYTASYSGIFNAGTFDVYAFNTLHPYSERDIKDMYPENYFGFDYSRIHAHYNHHYPIYEAKAQSLPSDRLLPNMYFLDFLQNASLNLKSKNDREIRATLGPALTDFIGVGSDPNDVIDLMTDHQTMYLPPYAVQKDDVSRAHNNSYLYLDNSYHLRNFLTGAFRNNSYPKDAEKFAFTTCENLIFTDQALIQYYTPGRLRETSLKRLPMYISVEVPRNVGGEWTALIASHEYEDFFMSRLKAEFDSGLYIQEHSAVERKNYQIKNDAGGVSATTQIGTKKYRSLDMFDMLTRALREAPKEEADNAFFMEPVTFNSLMLHNPDQGYRYGRTMPTLRFTKAAAKKVNDDGIQIAVPGSSGGVPKLEFFEYFNASDFWYMASRPLSKARYKDEAEYAAAVSAENPKAPSLGYPQMSEVIAYRIEKVSPPTLSAGGTSEAERQNIYFFNSALLDDFVTYYDSQVRQNTDYTYRVYEYRVVQGYRYKYSDLRPTRILANQIVSGFTYNIMQPLVSVPTQQLLSNCLEFYDFQTNAPTTPLVPTTLANGAVPLSTAYEKHGGSSTVEKMSYLGGEYNLPPDPTAQADTSWTKTHSANLRELANTSAGPSQVISDSRYIADFNVTVEPSVRIVESLIEEKTLIVGDNPPIAPDITPYQHMDDSQIIGFYINRETHISSPYPTPLNSEEAIRREMYLSSRGITADENIKEESASNIRTLEIYRIDKRPNSIGDFNGNLVHSKDLRLSGYEQQSHKNCFYEEKVSTNKKYYYLFRFVNENGVPGRWSPIQVVELIHDGGYKYAEFDVIYESTFKTMQDLVVSTPIKKLFHAPPAVRQVTFDDRTVDYSKAAHEQFNNMKIGTATDQLWDKTFKFRLTSKKTGNKIDLNVTYRLKDTYNGFSR